MASRRHRDLGLDVDELRVWIGRLKRRAGAGGDDEVDGLLDVVEGEDLVEEHEVGVGDVEVVGGERGQVLDLADDVVGEEADGAGGEGRQAGKARGGVAVEGELELGEDVAGVGDAAACRVR